MNRNVDELIKKTDNLLKELKELREQRRFLISSIESVIGVLLNENINDNDKLKEITAILDVDLKKMYDLLVKSLNE